MKRRRTYIPPILDDRGDASPLEILLFIAACVAVAVCLAALAIGLLLSSTGAI